MLPPTAVTKSEGEAMLTSMPRTPFQIFSPFCRRSSEGQSEVTGPNGEEDLQSGPKRSVCLAA